MSKREILRKQHKFSRAHWLGFIVNKTTDTRIYNLCDVATSESGQFDKKTKLTSVSPCVCPVIDNEFRQHCQSSLRIHSAYPHPLAQCYEEIHDQ